jgi:hypothetical protein
MGQAEDAKQAQVKVPRQADEKEEVAASKGGKD